VVNPAWWAFACWTACILPAHGETAVASAADDDVLPFTSPKRRVALVRFEDHSGFPAVALRNGEDAGSLAGLLLAERLSQSGEFLVLKRGQLGDMDRGEGLPGREPEVIGVSAFIHGSVKGLRVVADSLPGENGKPAWRSARASLAVRLADPLTGAIFFADSAEGVSAMQSGGLIGFHQGRADTALPELALAAAIGKLADRVAASLRAQPWRAGILEAGPDKVIIAAGARAGIKPGQELRIVRQGRRVKEPSSGIVLELPGRVVGRVRVLSQFGSGDLDEGSVCALLEGKDITVADRVELDEGG
jgi:curli biogenesis system outer membrane secretion channel CsgG